MKDELHEKFQDAHVFYRRRALLLESQMQSESAVGVRLKIYWPYCTLGQHLFANGGLLFVAGTSTVQPLMPCGFQLAARWTSAPKLTYRPANSCTEVSSNANKY